MALLFLIVATGALAAVLRRWFDPVPLRCWLFWGAVLALAYGPALWPGRVLLPVGSIAQLEPYRSSEAQRAVRDLENARAPIQGDLITETAPWLFQVRDQLRSGRWPYWNPFSGVGEPLLANPQAQAFQPWTWFTLMLPRADAFTAMSVARVAYAFVFLFLFLRRLGISEGPALGASVAFGMGGFLQGWLSWPLGNSAAAFAPLLYAIVLLDQRGRRRDRAFFALALSLVLLSGHPEAILHILIIAVAFAGSRIAARTAGRRLALVRSLIGPALLALCLTAPALLPVARTLPHSLRAALLEQRDQATPEGSPKVSAPALDALSRMASRLAPLVAPYAQGNNFLGKYWGAMNSIHDVTPFAGTVAMLLALLAVVSPGRRFPAERFLLGLAVACLVVVARPPTLTQFFAHVPLLDSSSTHHDRLALGLNLAIACLAAFAWERALRSEISRRGIFAVGAIIAVLSLWATIAFSHPGRPETLRLERWGALGLHLVAVAGTIWSLRRHRAPGGLRSAAARALPALVAVELLLVFHPNRVSGPTRWLYRETPTITFLRERAAPGERLAGLSGVFAPNMPSVHGLADLRSSNPAKSAEMARLLAPLNGGRLATFDAFESAADPLLDRLAVRWLIVGEDSRFQPTRRHRLAQRRGGTRLYRRRGDLGLLRLPRRTRICKARQAWSQCLEESLDARAADAWIRAAPPGGKRGGWVEWAADAPRESRVRLHEVNADRKRAEAHLVERRLLTAAVFQDGGWRIVVDGRRVPAGLANGPLVAAWLPSGAKRVDFVHHPPGFLLGLGLAALGLATTMTAFVSRAGRPPP